MSRLEEVLAKAAFEEAKREYTKAVQRMLDTEARSQGFDNIFSAVTYAGSNVPRYNGMGVVACNWRDNVWDACEAILEDVQAGNRTAPTVEELLSELPTVNWPA